MCVLWKSRDPSRLARIILVGQENQIEATQNLPDVCFLDIRSLFCLPLPTQIQRCLCKCRWNLAISYGVNPTILRKITTLLKADCEQLQVLAAKHTASLQLLCAAGGNQARSDARTEFKILEPSPKGGVEAGRAHSCRLAVQYQYQYALILILNIEYLTAKSPAEPLTRVRNSSATVPYARVP